MNTINIFLASSISELAKERTDLHAYLSGADLRDLFRNDGVDIQLVRSEDIYKGYEGKPSQNYLNKRLEECKISIFLFKAKNKEEAETAIKAVQKKGAGTRIEFAAAKKRAKKKEHKMFVYFLDDSEGKMTEEIDDFIKSEMNKTGMYGRHCANISEVKALFIVQLLGDVHEWLCSTGKKYKRNEKSMQSNSSLDEIKEDGNELYREYKWHNDRLKVLQPDIKSTIEKAVILIDREISSQTNKDGKIVGEYIDIINLYRDANMWGEIVNYDKMKRFDLLYNWHEFLYKTNQHGSAEEVLSRLVELDEEMNDPDPDSLERAIAHTKMGHLYYQQEEYEKAIKYYYDVLRIYELKDRDNAEIPKIQELVSKAKAKMEDSWGKKISTIATFEV